MHCKQKNMESDGVGKRGESLTEKERGGGRVWVKGRKRGGMERKDVVGEQEGGKKCKRNVPLVDLFSFYLNPKTCQEWCSTVYGWVSKCSLIVAGDVSVEAIVVLGVVMMVVAVILACRCFL